MDWYQFWIGARNMAIAINVGLLIAYLMFIGFTYVGPWIGVPIAATILIVGNGLLRGWNGPWDD